MLSGESAPLLTVPLFLTIVTLINVLLKLICSDAIKVLFCSRRWRSSPPPELQHPRGVAVSPNLCKTTITMYLALRFSFLRQTSSDSQEGIRSQSGPTIKSWKTLRKWVQVFVESKCLYYDELWTTIRRFIFSYLTPRTIP